jgi:hypothetical protein
MQKVFVSYRLLPGVSLEHFCQWSREIDQLMLMRQPGIIRFEIYAIEGAEDGQPFCQIMEDIEADSFEAFQSAVAGPDMAYCRETFPLFVDQSSVQVIYGSRIAPFVRPGVRPPLPAMG